MILRKINLINFRNYRKININFDKNINIIIGDNAQGKTNILESIYFLALTKSYRTIDMNLINHESDFTKVKGEINYEGYYFIHVRPDKVYNISAEGDYYGNYYEDYNSLIMVYSATVHDNRNDGYKAVPDEVEVSEPFDDTKIYFPVMVKNILKFWNGSLYCDYENMEVCGINDLMFYDGLNNNLLGYKTIKRMKNDLINSEFENFEYTSTGTLAE